MIETRSISTELRAQYMRLRRQAARMDVVARKVGAEIRARGPAPWDHGGLAYVRELEEIMRNSRTDRNYNVVMGGGEEIWQQIGGDMMAFSRFSGSAAHDYAHIGEPIVIQFPFLAKKRELSEHQKAVLDRFVEDAPNLLELMNYPARMFTFILGQHLNVPPQTVPVEVRTTLQTLGLALAMRVPQAMLPFATAEYSTERARDPQFTGLLYQVEDGLRIDLVKPYLLSILYNMVKNPWKAFVENPVLRTHDPRPFSEVAGFKVVVVARRHPRFANLVTIEIIDNGMGFDLNTITDKAVEFVAQNGSENGDALKGLLPQKVIDRFIQMRRSPYAGQVTISDIQYAVFLYRLSGFDPGNPEVITSGLGLWGAKQLTTQMHGMVAVGSNRSGMGPFDRGARFMLVLPQSPKGFVPADLSVLHGDLKYGTDTTPWFAG